MLIFQHFFDNENSVLQEFEKNTIDVTENNKNKTINLSTHPRIRIFKLKKPIKDIIQNKK